MAIKANKILSVITARGGSKSIPKKNVKFLGKHPLFAYSVFSSMESKYVDLTVVSSNCPEVEHMTNLLIEKQSNHMGVLTEISGIIK